MDPDLRTKIRENEKLLLFFKKENINLDIFVFTCRHPSSFFLSLFTVSLSLSSDLGIHSGHGSFRGHICNGVWDLVIEEALMDTKTGFSDSNEILSNSSSICCLGQASSEPEPSTSEVSGLNRLSENLHSIFESSDSELFADARLAVAGGREIPVHRCILSARSGFFRNVFSGSKDRGSRFELKDLAKDYEVGFNSVMAVLGYL